MTQIPPPLQYLLNRGLTTETITRWKLSYDKASDRIVFPFYDENGDIIGDTRRIYKESQTGSKYINSSAVSGFKKSEALYGIHMAIPHILHKNAVIVTEGQFDAILSYQRGYKNIVAISGTALSLKQIGILRKYTDTIILAFDGDEAGRKATERSIDRIREYDLLTEYKDFTYSKLELKDYPDTVEHCDIAFEMLPKESLLRRHISKRQDWLMKMEKFKNRKPKDDDIPLETIKKIPITTLLEGHKMTSIGNNQKKCLCPLHNEKTPSFTIYGDTNSFYCYGCGVGGSNIDLIMKRDKLSTGEAIRLLKQYL